VLNKKSSQNKEDEDQHAPDVSVIVVNWNLRDYLRRCLKSILLQSGNLAVETIVVDNASDDGSISMLEQEFFEVSRIINRENVGFARASNQGMEKAEGRYLFLLNNDAELLEGALSSLVDYMDTHPDVGVCGPRVVNSDGTLQVHSKGFYPTISRMAGQLFLPRNLRHPAGRSLGLYEFNDDRTIREFDWLSGCALLVRREAVVETGMFDTGIFMYCEDIDWCYRMKKKGWKVVNNPQVDVIHFGGQSMKLQEGAAVGSHAAALADFYARYHSRSATTVFRIVLSTGYVVQAIGWMLAAIVGKREGLDKLKRRFSHGRGRSVK